MRHYVIALCAACSALAAQQTPRDTFALSFRGGYFSVSVPDMEASMKWYSEKLGMRRLFYFPPTATVHAGAAAFQNGGLFVEVVQVEGASDLSRYLPSHAEEVLKGRQFVYGFMKAGASVDNFDATVAALRGRGVEIVDGPNPAKADQPASVTIRDNSGNRIILLDASYKPH